MELFHTFSSPPPWKVQNTFNHFSIMKKIQKYRFFPSTLLPLWNFSILSFFNSSLRLYQGLYINYVIGIRGGLQPYRGEGRRLQKNVQNNICYISILNPSMSGCQVVSGSVMNFLYEIREGALIICSIVSLQPPLREGALIICSIKN